MSKKRDSETQLLADTLHDDWASGRAAEFARAAASTARRRRFVRQTLASAVVVVVIAAVGFVATPRRPVVASDPQATRTVATRGYEIISDEQLLALVKDEPLLVVRRSDGTRQITLLQPQGPTSASLE